MQAILIENTEKIKKIIRLVKSKQLSVQEADDILAFVSNMLDDFLLKDNTIVYRLNRNLIKNNRIIDIDIKAQQKLVSTKETHEFLYLVKTLFCLMLRKKYFFNLYIYSEINMIVNYYVTRTAKDKHYDSLNERFSINEIEYHDQVIMFKYLFSVFDKMMFISAFIVDKYNLNKVSQDNNYIFTKDFENVSMPLFKTSVRRTEFKDYLSLLNRSSAFHFIRKLRNNLEHSFTDPKSEYNLSLENELLFILVVRTLAQIHKDFKNDDEIFKVIKLNN